MESRSMRKEGMAADLMCAPALDHAKARRRHHTAGYGEAQGPALGGSTFEVFCEI
jgi:hypothetical protein